MRLRKLLLSLFACAVGAWVGTVVASYPFAVYMNIVPRSLRFTDAVVLFLGMGSYLSVITFAAMVIIGLPLQYRMQKRGETTWWLHARGGMIGGAAVSTVTIIGLVYLPCAVLAGFIAGSIFWLVRRPDRDEDEKVAA